MRKTFIILTVLLVMAPLAALAQGYTGQMLFFTKNRQAGGDSLYPGFMHNSVWSAITTSSTGKMYVAVANHLQPTSAGQPHGNVAMFKYDPELDTMIFLGDLKSISSRANNWMADESMYKVHSALAENADGKIYFSSFEHPPTYFLRGSHIFTIDINTDSIRDYSATQPKTMKRNFSVITNNGGLSDTSGLFIQYYGLKNININPNIPYLMYAVTYPDAYLIKYDFRDGSYEVVPGGPVNSGSDICYVFIVDNAGNLFFMQKTGSQYTLKKYDQQLKTVSTIQANLDNYRFSVVVPTPDRDTVYCATFKGNLYRLVCSQNKIEFVRKLRGLFFDAFVNLNRTPDGQYLYYVDIGNSGAPSPGTGNDFTGWQCMWRCNLQTLECDSLFDVKPLVGDRTMSYGGPNTWDKLGNFYMPVWTLGAVPSDLAILKLHVPEFFNSVTKGRQTAAVRPFMGAWFEPNPFAGNTRVRLTVGQNTQVRMGIYDLKNNLVKNLVNGYKSRGSYQVEWNATNEQGRKVQPGIYFCYLNGKLVEKVFVIRP